MFFIFGVSVEFQQSRRNFAAHLTVRPVADSFNLFVSLCRVVHQVFNPCGGVERGGVFPLWIVHVAACLVEIDNVRFVWLPRALKYENGCGEVLRSWPNHTLLRTAGLRLSVFHSLVSRRRRASRSAALPFRDTVAL